MRPELIRLRQIVVRTEAEAQALIDSIRRGEAFIDVAQAHSVAPEAKRGGDLGVCRAGVA